MESRGQPEGKGNEKDTALVNALVLIQTFYMAGLKKNISTSYVERQNLTMRMHVRRFLALPMPF